VSQEKVPDNVAKFFHDNPHAEKDLGAMFKEAHAKSNASKLDSVSYTHFSDLMLQLSTLQTSKTTNQARKSRAESPTLPYTLHLRLVGSKSRRKLLDSFATEDEAKAGLQEFVRTAETLDTGVVLKNPVVADDGLSVEFWSDPMTILETQREARAEVRERKG
jgi:hypothetical protein